MMITKHTQMASIWNWNPYFPHRFFFSEIDIFREVNLQKRERENGNYTRNISEAILLIQILKIWSAINNVECSEPCWWIKTLASNMCKAWSGSNICEVQFWWKISLGVLKIMTTHIHAHLRPLSLSHLYCHLHSQIRIQMCVCVCVVDQLVSENNGWFFRDILYSRNRVSFSLPPSLRISKSESLFWTVIFAWKNIATVLQV